MNKMEVDLVPFVVPSYVTVKTPSRVRQDGFHESPKYHLSELPDETLEALCKEFRDAVFAKARIGTEKQK